MRHYLSRLVPIVLTACLVDTPVAEGDPADRLAEGLGAWCESMCSKYRECDSRENSASCVEDCQEYFNAVYIGRSESCESAALRIMDCIDHASCVALNQADPCNAWTEEERCEGSSSQEPYCRAEDNSGTGLNGACETGFTDCYDGHEYRFYCSGVDDPPRCQCLVDDVVVGGLPATGCQDSDEIQRICGWPQLAHAPGSPLVRRLTCNHGSSGGVAGGGPVGECDVLLEDCNDGHSYGMVCRGVEEGCTCEVDGEGIAEVFAQDALCPYFSEPNMGRVAMNFACDFRLATSTVIE